MASGGTGESCGHGQEAPSEGLGDDWAVGDGAKVSGPTQQVVRECDQHQPGGVGLEDSGGALGESGTVFEVSDHQFLDGVVAVVGIQADGLAQTVGDERVVAPVGPQLCLRAEQARVRRTINLRPPRVLSAT